MSQESLGEKAPLQVEADDCCFVCGINNESGIKARFAVDEASLSASVELVLDERFQGWQGVVHGGIVASLLDEAAIYAARPLAAEGVTAEMTVRYRKPLSTAQRFRVEARVTSHRRRIAEVESRLVCDATVHAEAKVRIMLLEKKGGTTR